MGREVQPVLAQCVDHLVALLADAVVLHQRGEAMPCLVTQQRTGHAQGVGDGFGVDAEPPTQDGSIEQRIVRDEHRVVPRELLKPVFDFLVGAREPFGRCVVHLDGYPDGFVFITAYVLLSGDLGKGERPAVIRLEITSDQVHASSPIRR